MLTGTARCFLSLLYEERANAFPKSGEAEKARGCATVELDASEKEPRWGRGGQIRGQIGSQISLKINMFLLFDCMS